MRMEATEEGQNGRRISRHSNTISFCETALLLLT